MNVKKLLICLVAILPLQITEVKADDVIGELKPPADGSGKKPKSLIPHLLQEL